MTRPVADKPYFVVVTGLSGAGQSTMLKVLEDMDFDIIDNLPLSLLAALMAQKGERPKSMAIGIDSRTRGMTSSDAVALLEPFADEESYVFRLVYLDCDREELKRRYNITRRKHPFALKQDIDQGISQEQALLLPIKDRAHHIIDTTTLKPAMLQAITQQLFGQEQTDKPRFIVQSFSYKAGIPRDADMILDARVLMNPYYEEALRRKTGQEPPIQAFVEKDPLFSDYIEAMKRYLSLQIQGYKRERRPLVTLAVGCTGGHHRSVFVAERLASWLQSQGYEALVHHRDLGHYL